MEPDGASAISITGPVDAAARSSRLTRIARIQELAAARVDKQTAVRGYRDRIAELEHVDVGLAPPSSD